ncbi:hypothetical protein SCE1572_24890 [Sorangium cellulosum So0157-2]|uniref:Uncharacterized protein n=3 Tax=Sorangium cellulosum TaxID=56 RepID=S4XW62_SORCE|nr:hypothetical protein SCE1572_24890 [Sorangium cellulosum So0157-2]
MEDALHGELRTVGALGQRRPQHVFVSYAEEDAPWVEGTLVHALQQAGLRCSTEKAFALGVPRLLEFERAVQEAERTVLVISSAYHADRVGRFISLLALSFDLERAEGAALALKMQPDPLPKHLQSLEVVDASVDRSAAVAALCHRLGRDPPPSARKPLCPYPGMAPFREGDRFFYGREREIAEILAAIEESIDVFIIGPSGSGKSSLIAAGLLPELEREGLRVRSMRPGAAPLQALARAQAAPTDGRREILLVDQLEELFSQSDRDTQHAFMDRLLAAREGGISLVAAIRADFYDELMGSALWPIDGPGRRRLDVLPLRGDALRDAIVRPAAAVDVHVEEALVERLLADAERAPGALPLLQEALVLLWERMSGRTLALASYRPPGAPRPGGLDEALVRRATQSLDELSPEQQTIARRVFLQLVHLGKDRLAARRQVPRVALAARERDLALFASTVDYLIGSRLLTSDGDSADATIDISHEALITAWPLFQEWLRDWRDREEALRRLEGKVGEWIRFGRGAGGLLDAAELPEAERWLPSKDAEVLGYPKDLPALVAASQRAIEERAEEARRSAARLRRRALGIGISAALALVAGGVAWRKHQEKARAVAAERWGSAAELAASRGRFDLAEYAIALAAEADPSTADKLLERYLVYRKRRVLVSAGQIADAATGRVVHAGFLGDVARTIVARDDGVFLAGTGSDAAPRQIACQSPSYALQCSRDSVALLCEQELLVVGATGVAHTRSLRDGTVVDAVCVSGELRVLERIQPGGRVLRLDPDTLEHVGPPEVYLDGDVWRKEGLCRQGRFRAFGARTDGDGVLIERGGPAVEGGLDTERRRFALPGLSIGAWVTVIPDDSCEIFFVNYTRINTPHPVYPLVAAPMPGASTDTWVVLEWDPYAPGRDLAAEINSLFPLPPESGFYAVYLTANGEIGLLPPVAPPVTFPPPPRIVATNASALSLWGSASSGSRSFRTVSIEGGDLVVRENGDLVARYASQVDSPARLVAGDQDGLVVVEGANAARLWRRADGVADEGMPRSAVIATELGISHAEIAEIERSR